MFEAIGLLSSLAKILLSVMTYFGIRSDKLRSYLEQVAGSQSDTRLPTLPNDDEKLQEEELKKTRSGEGNKT